jgi:UDP-2,4-diacetamido-2,4,6-trideoxy-beta-L-altropyranose hydrolase
VNKPTKTTVLGSLTIRADANSQIGTGHVMRCLALAEAWQNAGGRVAFLMAASTSSSLERRLVSEGMEVVRIASRAGSSDDASQTASFAEKLGAFWIVVDGYHFGAAYQRIIKASGQHLLAIDDYGHADHHYADFVLNQNLDAHERFYASRESYTQLLLGTRYSLLRREFFNWRGWKREIPRVGLKILVTLGGSDPDNVSLKVLQALQHVRMNDLEAVIVLGASNPHYPQLQAAVQESRISISLQSNVTRMPELMAWADVAISAAGITAWELTFMGVPSLFLIQADNQRGTAESLDALGVARNLGRPADLSCNKIASEILNLLVAAEKRTEMARCGRELVDANGATRVLMHLSAHGLQIRNVREDDCKQFWEWANDPDVRAVSFSSEPISWEQHIEWFRSKLNNPACVLHIGTNGGEIPVGQIRYDSDGDQAIVSVSLDRQFRGKGYGSRLIWLSAQEILDTTAINTLHAYVKQANETSVRAFEKAGYQNLGTTTVDGHEALDLVLSRSAKDAS